MINPDNHEADVHECRICHGDALNKGYHPDANLRQIFCIKDGTMFVPLNESLKRIKRYKHEYLHYKGTHLDKLYLSTMLDLNPQKIKEYEALDHKDGDSIHLTEDQIRDADQVEQLKQDIQTERDNKTLDEEITNIHEDRDELTEEE